MNSYGKQLQSHWERYAPQQYAELTDPETYFTELGERVEAEVVETQRRLEATMESNLTYSERASQMRAVRMQAQELVLSEYRPVEAPDGLELIEVLTDDLPRLVDIQYQISQIEDRAEDEELDPATDERLEALKELRTVLEAPTPSTQRQIDAQILQLQQLSAILNPE